MFTPFAFVWFCFGVMFVTTILSCYMTRAGVRVNREFAGSNRDLRDQLARSQNETHALRAYMREFVKVDVVFDWTDDVELRVRVVDLELDDDDFIIGRSH